MKILSLNGLDGIGKTEQIKWLSGEEAINCLGGLSAYSERWPKLKSIEFFNWWFRDVPCNELFSIIIESLRTRQLAHKEGQINLNDRGSRMFKAVCVATLLVREEVPTRQAIRTIDDLFDRELSEMQPEEEILLKPDLEYKERIRALLQIVDNRSSEYLPWQTEMYAEYQGWLTRLMDHYFRDADPKKVILVNECVISVQNKLRRILNETFGSDLQLICVGLKKLVAFGGMSESGKSCFAEQLRTHHHYCRLKIKYFEGVVRARDGKSRPNTLGKEILDFLERNKHVTHASIESLHAADLPAYLKLLLGPRMTTVFLDVPEDIRVSRTAKALGVSEMQALADTRAKDAIKLSRGVTKVRDIADVVFDNSTDDFEGTFNTFVTRL